MVAGIDHGLLSEASACVADRLGLHFPQERWPELVSGLETAARELGLKDLDACVQWLARKEYTSQQIESLASYLTVGETFFYRDCPSFEVLERVILPPLLAKRREDGRTLRIWSAGCCTGEEAYSLAITCARALPDLTDWAVSVLATDINPKFLAKARAGEYTHWSFRGVPEWLRPGYFVPAGEKRLAIIPSIKRLVQFQYLNLAQDLYPSIHNHTNAMDIIFCRNVLMYFTPEHQRRVISALYNSLVEGGILVVNPAEASTALFSVFTMENHGESLVYRKTSKTFPTQTWQAPYFPASRSEALFEASPAVSPLLPSAPPTVPAVGPVLGVDIQQNSAPDASQEHLSLARTAANQGRLREALAFSQEAIEAQRTNPAAHFLCATVFQELGMLQQAVAELGRVLYLDQDSVMAHHALGMLYKQLGKQRESKRHFGVALVLLSVRGRDEILQESDGMTCGRLVESVRAMMGA